MTFAKNSPIKATQAAGVRGNASFRRPPGGTWSGTVLGNDGQLWDVVELEGSWQLKLAGVEDVTDVYAGPDLVALLQEHLVTPEKRKARR